MCRTSDKLARGLCPALQPPNIHSTPPVHGAPNLCTPVDLKERHTPPSELRRDSLSVPPSTRMIRLAQGSGVSVYRMDRSPRNGRQRSPWVLKKASVSPVLVRERRRVERSLERESCMLAAMSHPNVVGFRAAQRLPDGHLCLALEHCEISLYQLIQERVKPHGSCVSPTRETRAGEVFSAAETARITHAVAAGLAYLHTNHRLMHGDVKSANILLARDLSRIKLCDLGVSIPLDNDLSHVLQPGREYEGTEPWCPPEALCRGEHETAELFEGAAAHANTMRLCDRTDIFAVGLVLWEMLAGDVPHAAELANGDEAYRQALGTRPPLPSLPPDYERLERIFRCCTQHQPDQRPSATELLTWLQPGSLSNPPTAVP